ncbi:MAG: hypothetical protein AAFV93_13425 [Chloroflexota bacterium]
MFKSSLKHIFTGLIFGIVVFAVSVTAVIVSSTFTDNTVVAADTNQTMLVSDISTDCNWGEGSGLLQSNELMFYGPDGEVLTVNRSNSNSNGFFGNLFGTSSVNCQLTSADES